MFENGGRGIGDKGKDNGLLVLLAVDDRQVWVEVGYDLEGIVTDGFAGETSRQVMAPYFRQGQYGQGLLAGTSRIIERIAADRNVTVTGVRVAEAPVEPTRDPVSRDVLLVVFIILFMVVPLLRRRGRRRRRAGAAASGRGVAATMEVPGAAARRGAARRAASADSAAGGAVGAVVERRGEDVAAEHRRTGGGVMRKLVTAGLVVMAATMASGCSYNRFVSQEEAVKAQWAQVENQLKRRNDLIPNLVGDHQGFAQQERDVFQAIADSRAKLAGARTPQETIQAANEQSSALSRLLVVVENYPELKSSEIFARLTDELSGTENRIATERMRYNERVQEYNTSRRQFPANITNAIFRFQDYPLFEAPRRGGRGPESGLFPAENRAIGRFQPSGRPPIQWDDGADAPGPRCEPNPSLPARVGGRRRRPRGCWRRRGLRASVSHTRASHPRPLAPHGRRRPTPTS